MRTNQCITLVGLNQRARHLPVDSQHSTVVAIGGTGLCTEE